MRVKMPKPYPNLAGLLLLALLWLGASGCETFNGPAENDLATVTITNRPLASVQTAVTKVFLAHGFIAGPAEADTLEFTRKGGHWDKLLYGSFVFEDKVTLKVTVTTQLQPDGAIVLSCQPWVVESQIDPVFVDDQQVRPLSKGPYEKLLKEIQKQLGE